MVALRNITSNPLNYELRILCTKKICILKFLYILIIDNHDLNQWRIKFLMVAVRKRNL